METYTKFTDMKAQYHINISYPLIDLEFSAISVKFQQSFFMYLDKIILKFIWKNKRIRIAKIFLRKKNNGCVLPDTKV